MLGKLYRCWSVLRAVGPHLGDRCLHGLQSLVEGQLQRLCLSVVLEEHQRLQQAVHLLCRKTGVPSIISMWTRGGAARSATSHPVHGGDQLAQSVHQSSVLHRASFLQTQLLPLSFASIL